MAKGYYLSTDGGENFEVEALLKTPDITLGTGVYANTFYSVKDSSDNLFIFCGITGGNNLRYAKIIKIDKLGNKTISAMDGNNSGNWVANNVEHQMIISRDGLYLFISASYNNAEYVYIYMIPILDINGSTLIMENYSLPGIAGVRYESPKFAIYQDRYIWVASGSTVSVYDYETKALIASVSTTYPLTAYNAMCLNSDNELYIIGNQNSDVGMNKIVFNGINILTKFTIDVGWTAGSTAQYTKQMLIDKWGDLVILTNSGTESHLLKYTTAGVLKDDVDLSVAEILGVGRTAYSLNVYSTRNQDGTLKDCQVSFENDLGLWLSEPVTLQGELFGTFTKVLNTGNVTYNNCNGGDNNYSVRC